MQSIVLLVLALCAGALIPIQAAANTVLSKSINGVAYASLMLFLVGLCFVSIFIFISKTPAPSLNDFLNAPALSYCGGVIVAIYVLSITYLAPRVGVGNAIFLIVTGQIIAATLIDHFGLMNAIQSPINFQRATGIAVMVIGLFLARS